MKRKGKKIKKLINILNNVISNYEKSKKKKLEKYIKDKIDVCLYLFSMYLIFCEQLILIYKCSF